MTPENNHYITVCFGKKEAFLMATALLPACFPIPCFLLRQSRKIPAKNFSLGPVIKIGCPTRKSVTRGAR